MVAIQTTGWETISIDLLTGRVCAVCNYKPDQWAWMRYSLYQGQGIPKDPHGRLFGSARLETPVARSAGDSVGSLPGGYYSVVNLGRELAAHPDGYHWMGWQIGHLALFQLECD
jgi:hypothetical protein